MSFWKLKNLSSRDAEPMASCPWEVTSPVPEFRNKEEFRAWCNLPDTNHVFFSMAEAFNPALRLSEVENPARLLHGFVGDYDSPADLGKVKAFMAKRSAGTRPIMMSTTFSGGLRAVWVFETPVMVDCPELAEAFMKQIATDLKVDKLAPGFDPASFKLTQYYELGRDWFPVEGATPVSTDFVTGMMVSATRNVRLPRESRYDIPMEVIADEVERRWPGRWPGSFEAGARGPLFWIEDGVDRIGCQVFPEGVVCYSSRSPQSFIPWKQLLGPSFVKEFEHKKEAECTDGIYWDSNKYWMKESRNRWLSLTKDDLILRFKSMGLATRPGKGEVMSESEEMLLAVQRLNHVDLAAPVVFDKRDIIDYKGVRILNVSTVTPMSSMDSEEIEARCPWLIEFCTRLWDPVPSPCGVLPHEFFLSWLKRFWQSSLSGTPLPGQALIISGPVDRGKSLLGTVILPMIMGGSGADAGAYLIGSDRFNRDICAAGVWTIDDNKSAATRGDHLRFGEALKKLVAVPEVIYRPMRVDPVGIPWRGRIILTCNDDSESLAAIPNLDNNILDKLIMLKVDPRWRANFGDYGSLERRLRAEIPYFLHWLSTREEPREVTEGASGRYGVNPYHHPAILADARNLNPSHRVTEILDLWIEDGIRSNKAEWNGTSTELMAELLNNPLLRDLVRDLNPIRLGILLSKIEYYRPMKTTKAKGKTRFKFTFDANLLTESE
jgi:hypothetical protein